MVDGGGGWGNYVSLVGKSGEFALVFRWQIRRVRIADCVGRNCGQNRRVPTETLLLGVLFRLNARATESEPGLFQIPMNNQQQPQITNTVVRCNKTQYTFI